METKSLIQASVKILRITELEIGNVVKLIEKGSSYSSSSLESYFGVVIDLLNSGKETYIQMLLFKKSYNNVSAEIKLYNGSEDLSLFPATIEEVKEDLGESLKGLQEDIEKGKKELDEKIQAYHKAESFVSGELSKELTEASFEELTTGEFKEEEKTKQIEAIKAD